MKLETTNPRPGTDAVSPAGQGDGGGTVYRGTSLIRNTPLVGSYSSPMPRDLW